MFSSMCKRYFNYKLFFYYKKNKYFCYILDIINKKYFWKNNKYYETLPEEYVNTNERIEIFNKIEQKNFFVKSFKKLPKKTSKNCFFIIMNF